MKLVIQRVKSASVAVDSSVVGEIGLGLCVFIGYTHGDTMKSVELMVDKLMKLRIFDDDAGKKNLSVQDIQGGVLLISQFTLYAKCNKGNRPSFVDVLQAEKANVLYHEFVTLCKKRYANKVNTGVFGAVMEVSLCNDGPVTIILEN